MQKCSVADALELSRVTSWIGTRTPVQIRLKWIDAVCLPSRYPLQPLTRGLARSTGTRERGCWRRCRDQFSSSGGRAY